MAGIRVHQLAKELSVKSKAIVDKCQAEGLATVKNHMAVLSAGLEATVREWFTEGAHLTTEETAQRVDLTKAKVRKPRNRKKTTKKEEAVDKTPEAAAEPAKKVDKAPAAKVVGEQAGVKETPADQPVAVEAVKAEEGKEVVPEAPAVAPAAEVPPEQAKPVVVKPEKREPVKPAGPVHVPAPAVLKGPRVIRTERPEPTHRMGPKRPAARTPIARTTPTPEVPPVPISSRPARRGKGSPATDEESEARKKSRARAHPRRGGPREAMEQIREWRDRDLLERSQRLAAATDHPQMLKRAQPRKKSRQAQEPGITGKVQVGEPIVLKDFCSAIATPFSKLFPKLMELGIPATINQTITAEQAEMLAMAFDIELEVVVTRSRYEELVEQFARRETEQLEPRAPIVTFLGHVDHGKTSLLDQIRSARVVDGEAGGITQHIGAYRYKVGDGYVVFLDTPGHEAFTSLRARGAQMTDIVVLVVAVDDGVMPQTVEAISHAKAANVPIVVALNKIDLPNADLNKLYGQLAEHELVSTEWGGDTDMIRTSAVTGEGIEELIEHLKTLAEVLDLRADPTGRATGVIIEARQDTTRGPIVDVMIQAGTLAVGDVLVAGRACGRVRALFDDMGQSVHKAGPATPVEILGLDEVPDAGDRFYVVPNLQTAKEVAEEKRQEDRASSWRVRPQVTLENIFEQVEAGDVKQLNIIVRGDTQGSVDVLKSKLEELTTDEVKVQVLHAGTGGITEGDVLLADASKAIIVGFGVVADDAARSQAQELKVQVKIYTVIYHLIEDITQAIEGMLEPTYEENVLGRATVKEVFKMSRSGTVAGCMVTDGTIERSAKVRVIRQNVIIREEAGLESLRRFKDDVRDVRQGLECGLKVAGFDDVKEGDIIEAYQTVEVARKLQPAGSG